MTKQMKRTHVQVNKDNFEEKALGNQYWAEFVKNLKGCSLEVEAARSGPNKGKKGFGTRAIVSKWNKNLNSPNSRKLLIATIDRMVDKGDAGKTPPNPGRLY